MENCTFLGIFMIFFLFFVSSNDTRSVWKTWIWNRRYRQLDETSAIANVLQNITYHNIVLVRYDYFHHKCSVFFLFRMFNLCSSEVSGFQVLKTKITITSHQFRFEISNIFSNRMALWLKLTALNSSEWRRYILKVSVLLPHSIILENNDYEKWMKSYMKFK